MRPRRTSSPALAAWVTALAVATGSAHPAAAQLNGNAAVLVGRTEHRVDAGYGVAASVGTTIGLAARTSGWTLVEIDAHALGGRLQGDTVARSDRRMGEVGLRVSMLPLPWLAVGAVAIARGYETPAATQRWTMLGGAAELHLDFAGGDIRSIIGAALLPSVRVSGQDDPDLAVTTNAGLRFVRGRILAGLQYSMERYVFPGDPVTGERREQLSGLAVSLGGRW